MRHRPGKFGFGRQSLLLLLLLAGAVAGRAAEPRRVLVVHSFGNAAPPFTTASTAFETALTGEMGEPVDLDEVSLDVARYTTLDMEEALVELVQKRQTRWQPDLVVPIGSPAGVFVANHRERLFPATTPVIYTGMDQRRLPAGALQRNAAFVGASYDLPGAVDDILQLKPDTTNIVMILGATPLEQFWADVLRREYAVFTNRVGFTWLTNLSFEQLRERSARLPPHSFMLMILYMRDASGVTHNSNEALEQLQAVANAPINGLFDEQLGRGIVGGRIYSDAQVGREAGRIAIRILRGEPAASFPPRVVGAFGPQYDGRQLERWNIRADRLPPGSTVLFREPTAWQRYRGWFSAGIAVFAAQGLLIFGLLLNRSRRRGAEQRLTDSRNQLRGILDTAVEGIITFDESGLIESVNPAAEKMFGYAAAELIGQEVNVLLPAARRAGQASSPVADWRDVRGTSREAIGRRQDGSEFPLHLAVSQFTFAGRSLFTGFTRDITEHKEAERTTREFGGRLIQAQEAERARLARELHDDITQRLARLAIDAGQAGQSATPAATETVRSLGEGLVRLSEDVHALSYQLHPSILEDLGLIEALRVECDRFTRQTGAKCDLKLPELPQLPPRDVALGLFRVTQEALRNAGRHASASTVEVTLRPLEDGLQLAVRDNGIGFDPQLKRDRLSLGLAGMRERVHLLGGDLDLESAPGHGTTVIAWVPLKRTAT